MGEKPKQRKQTQAKPHIATHINKKQKQQQQSPINHTILLLYSQYSQLLYFTDSNLIYKINQ